ncbi:MULTISPECIES: DUF4176 domain-containing protein [Bacillus cereus group]|uniref:DUF4176 domain-containing protein n=1 Tax=Bacillus TaxID=1386 RepID=UPI000B6F46EB|nr:MULTISPECIES: DUF4176 domain-containing protein [Bacillus cereus group]MEB9411387.1 DUF4176 domain-containing protein [Bacillus cereus]OUA88834.1 hypothetical protein BK706_17050 [Bacillus thuringiensis serovar leesis]
MEEVLLPIGTVVKVEGEYGEEPETCMIIGRRVINPASMKSWDYISVYYPEGFKRTFTKTSDGYKHEEDLFYFNHTEIIEVVSNFE